MIFANLKGDEVKAGSDCGCLSELEMICSDTGRGVEKLAEVRFGTGSHDRFDLSLSQHMITTLTRTFVLLGACLV